MTSVTQKPHCLVCSTDPMCMPAGNVLKFTICSQQCKLELWRSMGIYDQKSELQASKYKKSGSTDIGHVVLEKFFKPKED